MKTAASFLKLVCLTVLFYLTVAETSAQTKHTFALGDTDFLLDGKPLQMISGEMHCYRIPKELWHDRIKKAKAMGLNTIGTYVFWNAHEETPGKYDFSDNNDIAGFVKAAADEGMWVVLRPSPYACAEWEFGGYPWWLLKDSTVKVRSTDPKFINAYANYIKVLAKQLVPHLVTNGGNILMVQFENEYGSYSDDKNYLDINRKIFRDAGFNGILFTCDGADQMPKGYLPGYLPAVNGLEEPDKIKALINRYHNGKGPYYVAEWYPGWFDQWGKRHNKTNANAEAAKLDKILSAGISINMYMFHGGTTRAFMNGANMNIKEPYAPQTSSYDYDAPLDEAGNPTRKYHQFREIITKHLPAGAALPDVPEATQAIKLPPIKLTAYAGIFNNLPKPAVAKKPLAFEDLDQAYGMVLYRTTITKGGVLKLKGLRDYAQIWVNGEKAGVLDRRLQQDSVTLQNVKPNAVLDILVENNGRINYGPYLTDNRHGITQNVTLNGTEVFDWKMYRLPFSNIDKYKFRNQENSALPGLYKGEFTVTQPGDTFLDMRGFGKGFVFLNGQNIGKYWQIGPQQTLYVPGVWLTKGKNTIVVFDQLQAGHKELLTTDAPILGQLQTK